MNATQKRALSMSRVFLIENIWPCELWDHLIANQIFTPLMLEYITCKQPRSLQVAMMLLDLQRRHYGAYEDFIKCLNDTHQEHCALEIRRNQRIVEGEEGTTAVTDNSRHPHYQDALARSFDINIGRPTSSCLPAAIS